MKPRTLLAVEGNAVLGFATTGATKDEDLPDYGELLALYVDPPHWGQGIGAALITAARARLVEAGFRDALLWVMAGNVRAERFYQKDGWAADGTRRSKTRRGVTTDNIRYRRVL